MGAKHVSRTELRLHAASLSGATDDPATSGRTSVVSTARVMGPFDDTSRGQLNVDQAVASGLAATQPVATTTRPNAPGIPPPEDPTGGLQSTLQVESPQWAGMPHQQDFAQVDVRRGNYNTGIVPTVNVQMPFAALANRQAALGQRKAALDKQVADFDLYSKVGSPDARYAQAFNKYATQGLDQWLNDYAASMHGGDRRAAIRDIATNPEAGRMWMNKSKEFQAVAEENKKWMDVAEKRLAQHLSGEATIGDPKAVAALSNFVASVDESRTPVGADGKPLDAGSFVTTARQAVPEIQKIQYMDEVLGDSMKNALQTITNTTIADRIRGGNIVLTKTETKQYEDAIKAYVESDSRFVEDYFDGDREEAKKFVRSFYPISTVEDKEFKGVNYAPEYMQQRPPAESAVASVIQQPVAQQAMGEMISKYSSYSVPRAVSGKQDVTAITPQKVVGKNAAPIYREALTDTKGNSVEVAMPVLKYYPDKGGWVWEGRSLTDQAISKLEQVKTGPENEDEEGNIQRVKDIVTNTSNLGEVKAVPASQNEAANMRMTGFRTAQEYVAYILNQKGYDLSPAEVDMAMKDKATRDLINSTIRRQ